MSQTTGELVGHVAGLYRFPVKSMAGEELRKANVLWTGVEGDRRYAFLRADGRNAMQIDFPWFTGREYPPLLTYKAEYEPRDGKPSSRVRVTTPDGRVLDVGSDALNAELSQRSGKAVSLLRLGRGAYDGSALSLLSTASIAGVAHATGHTALSPQRFRPNIVVELAGGTHEDRWVGCALSVGGGKSPLKLWVTRTDPRCMMINIDPATGQQQPEVLRHVAQTRHTMLGIYATVLSPAAISIGDEIRLISLTQAQDQPG